MITDVVLKFEGYVSTAGAKLKVSGRRLEIWLHAGSIRARNTG